MNWPSDSRKAMTIPLSPVTFGSCKPSLFVPTKTMPPATTTLPYVCEPNAATHLTFFLVLTSQLVGIPFIFEIIFRSAVPPHMGQSPEPGSDARADGRRQTADGRSTKAESRKQNADGASHLFITVVFMFLFITAF